MAKAKSTRREVTIELELTEEEAQLVGAWAFQTRQTGPGRVAGGIAGALEEVGVDCEAYSLDWDKGERAIVVEEDE